MRKANFKMPYITDMKTEKTTYETTINKVAGAEPIRA